MLKRSLVPPRPWRDERLFPALRAILPCVSSARSSLTGRGEDYTQSEVTGNFNISGAERPKLRHTAV